MPYIKDQNRQYFDKFLNTLKHCSIANPGELNYLITELINQYHITHTKNYQTINDVVGALEGAKQEYYRRVAGPYENMKIDENGDVYVEEVLR